MNATPDRPLPQGEPPPAALQAVLHEALGALDRGTSPADRLRALVDRGLDRLPLPGSGATLQRWQALAAVAAHDLSLAKLYEGHTDAIAIRAELRDDTAATQGSTWGTWAAEAPGGRAMLDPAEGRRVRVHGAKHWCSGAADLDHGLITAWFAEGRGPQLVRVAMDQRGVVVNSAAWQAVGMAGSASLDVAFNGAAGSLVGEAGDYLTRPGFWQGGAGVAACWYGGALALGEALHRALAESPPAGRSAFRLAALGKVDVCLQATAAVLRDSARWIDAHPHASASGVALRSRLAAESCATRVLDEAGQALGAGAFCRDAAFARMAADLPVFVRQSHGDRDFAALGELLASSAGQPWML